MKLIQGYGIDDGDWELNYLTKKEDYLTGTIAIANKDQDGDAWSPIIKARLIEKYLALNILPYGQGLEGALYSSNEDTPMRYNLEEEKWEESDCSKYYPDTLLTEYIQHWYKPFRIRIKIPKGSYLYELKVGLDILVSFDDYLLNYALVRHLTKKIKFGYVSNPRGVGGQSIIDFPEMFDKKINKLKARKIETEHFYLNPILENNVIKTEDEITGPTMITFEYTPKVRFIYQGAYQVESLPCLIIRKKEETNIRKGFYREWISKDPNSKSIESKIEVRNIKTYNIPLELLFIAPNLSFCKQLYEQILGLVESKPINVEATGEQIGLYWGKGIIRDGDEAIKTKQITENLFSIIVNCEIKNVCISI